MACFAIVVAGTDVRATVEEVALALVNMGLDVYTTRTELKLTCKNGIVLSRPDAESPWVVTRSAYQEFDPKQFVVEVERAKIILEAKRQGYEISRDEFQGDERVVLVTVR